MKNLNKVTLIGRLGKDPEMRYIPSGKAITAFSLATDHSYKKGDEWVNETDWHNVEC
jgi:single-strand DNA-binding protein